jgi:nucleotide-binding universal stress UspA family protein
LERIIVGVDGSPTSSAALRWAVAYAASSGAAVEAWHAWHVAYRGDGGPPPDELAAESAARTALESAVAAAALDVPIRQVLVRAVPASALLDAARNADLLVVGASATARPRLGAVSAQVVAAAGCPVVVVPASS